MDFLIPFSRVATEIVEINYHPDLLDDPTRHYWRAFLTKEGSIFLRAFAVVRTTEKGVWINRESYFQGGEWVHPSESDVTFQIAGSNQSWSKPTRSDAIKSLIIRTERRMRRVLEERDMIAAFAKQALTLYPEHSSRLAVILAMKDRT